MIIKSLFNNCIKLSGRWVPGISREQSTEINQPLDSETLPWLTIPATQPWAPTQVHLGTHHIVITVEREKKGGVVGGKQENKKSINAKNNHLKKKQRYMQRSSQ